MILFGEMLLITVTGCLIEFNSICRFSFSWWKFHWADGVVVGVGPSLRGVAVSLSLHL